MLAVNVQSESWNFYITLYLIIFVEGYKRVEKRREKEEEVTKIMDIEKKPYRNWFIGTDSGQESIRNFMLL